MQNILIYHVFGTMTLQNNCLYIYMSVGDTVGIFIMATDYTSENPQPNLPHPPRKVIHFKAGFTTSDKVLA